MTDIESRIRAALRDELDAIEPSVASWERIRRGRVQPARRDLRRPIALVAATAAAAAAIVVALVTWSPPEGGRVTDLAPPDPEEQPGLVVDELGDAPAAHLDLERARVETSGDLLRVTWTLAEALPEDAGTVDYRVAFTGDGGEPLVLVVRFEGETRLVGTGRCAVGPATPDCTDREFTILEAEPRAEGETVSVTIPLAAIEIPVERLSWTAYVREA